MPLRLLVPAAWSTPKEFRSQFGVRSACRAWGHRRFAGVCLRPSQGSWGGMHKLLIAILLALLLGLPSFALASPHVDTSSVSQFKVSSTAANDRAGQHGLCGRRS